MEKIFIALFILMSTNVSRGDSFFSTIHSIDMGQLKKEAHLIRFDNGRVGFLRNEKSKVLIALKKALDENQPLRVELDQQNDLIDFKINRSFLLNEDINELPFSREPYRPAVLKDMNSAIRMFNKMRKKYTVNGECFNRAHIWTYEEFKQSKTNMMKVFMFFTEKYIRKYKFKWWFHVTPMIYVKDFKSPRALDRRYNGGPRQLKTWSDTFVKTKRSCKTVTKFDDFWLNQKIEDCFHIHSSMYYVMPRDLEKRDITGIEKEAFIEKEIRKAYSNGFGIKL